MNIYEKTFEEVLEFLKLYSEEYNQIQIFKQHQNKNPKIYCLIDPFDELIKYVGKTKQFLNARFRDHLREKNLIPNTPKNNWIKKINEQKIEPLIAVIEYTDEKNLKNREVFWNKKLREIGFPLKNCTEGGEGGSEYFTNEIKLKFSLLKKGKKFSNAHKQNISKALKGKKKINPRKGFVHSFETKQKIAQKALGRKWTEEQKNKIKGRPSKNKGKKIHKDGKPIFHYSIDHIFIKEYDSIKTASFELGISRWKIYASINNKVKEPYTFGYFKLKNN